MPVKEKSNLVKQVADEISLNERLESGALHSHILAEISATPHDAQGIRRLYQDLPLYLDPEGTVADKGKRSNRRYVDYNKDGKIQWWEKAVFILIAITSTVLGALGLVI